ncbi:MAG: CDP-glycerol glycerophosphotransferase family protein [Eubacterium sp.]
MKSKILAFAKKYPFVLSFIRRVKIFFDRLRYLPFYLTVKTDDKMILFEAYMGRQYSCSPKAIYLHMLGDKAFDGYTFVWAFKNPDDFAFLNKNKNTLLIKSGGREYFKYFAKAKYWVVNSRINEAIVKKSSQVYVQCWHGTPLKRLGYDIDAKNGNAMNSVKDIRYKHRVDSKRYTYMISPSAFCSEKFASAFNLKDKSIIKEIGYPRNDYLYTYTQKDVDRIKKELNIPPDKKVILYAPTWRDNQHDPAKGYTYTLHIDFDYLKKMLCDEYVILFRSHYFIANYIDLSKFQDFVFNVSQYNDINELYVISDLLVTDYSSVFFDYANLKRPMLFYMYDFKEYKNEMRDFYIDISELPGPITETETELAQEILNLDTYREKYGKKYIDFYNKYNYLDDGKAAARAASLLK